MSPHLDRDEESVPEVEDLLRLIAEIPDRIEPGFEEPEDALVTEGSLSLVGPEHVPRAAKLDAGMNTDKERGEVAAIECRTGPRNAAGQRLSSKPGSRRQATPEATDKGVNGGKPDKQALIEAPVPARPPRAGREGGADPVTHLLALLRHCPPVSRPGRTDCSGSRATAIPPPRNARSQ